MGRFENAFLRFVGVEYAALGLIGLVALFVPSSGLLPWLLCEIATLYLLAAPLALTFGNGVQAICLEQPGCDLDTDVIQHARATLVALCAISLVGGLLGIWGLLLETGEPAMPCGSH